MSESFQFWTNINCLSQTFVRQNNLLFKQFYFTMYRLTSFQINNTTIHSVMLHATTVSFQRWSWKVLLFAQLENSFSFISKFFAENLVCIEDINMEGAGRQILPIPVLLSALCLPLPSLTPAGGDYKKDSGVCRTVWVLKMWLLGCSTSEGPQGLLAKNILCPLLE